MERIQSYYRINKNKKYLETFNPNIKYPMRYNLQDDEIEIVEKLIQRDLKTALLYRRHSKNFIVNMCNDIIEHKG